MRQYYSRPIQVRYLQGSVRGLLLYDSRCIEIFVLDLLLDGTDGCKCSQKAKTSTQHCSYRILTMYRFVPLVLACLAVPALGARQLQMNNTVVDLAVATPSLSTLVTAVTTADLATALSDPNATLTVFAPDNDAFAALAPGLLTNLLTPGFQMHLKDILFYHVFSDAAILSTALATTQNITMMNGEILTVTKANTTVTVTTTDGQMANIIMADVEGSNGVVHIIDDVLLPSSIMVTVIALDDNYSTLLSLIALAGLEATLMGGPFTLLAPTNEAFAELDIATLDFLASGAGLTTLKSILLYHVIPGSVTSDMLLNDMMVGTVGMADMVMNDIMVGTVQGGMVTFMEHMGKLMVNDATIEFEKDMLAFNGVAHAIDMVLMPPGSMAPTMTPMSGMGASTTAQTSDMSGSLAVGASLSAVFAAVLAVVL
jgi:uncharacterized surface protein with fasciclin (FAS1) repeats